MARFILQGFLTTLSPMHISAAGPFTYNIEHQRKRSGKPKEGNDFPLTAIQCLPVPNEAGLLQDVPVIPANNLMGHLRRHGAALILDVLRRKGEQVTVSTFSALQCGAATGQPDGRATFEELREARRHPYLGLFGGGPKLMRRRVHCENSVPYYEDTKFMFEKLRHPALTSQIGLEKRCVGTLTKWERDENGKWVAKNGDPSMTATWTCRRNDDLSNIPDIAEISSVIEDFEEAMTARQMTILNEKANKDKGDEAGSEKASRTSTEAFTALEFVVPGTVFPVTWTLDLVNEAQLGLFLLALDRFCDIDTLGGHGRNGFGRVSLDDVQLAKEGWDENGGRKYVYQEGLFHNSRLVRSHAAVAPLLEAWREVSEALSAAELNRLLTPPPADPDKKKGGKKKGKTGNVDAETPVDELA